MELARELLCPGAKIKRFLVLRHLTAQTPDCAGQLHQGSQKCTPRVKVPETQREVTQNAGKTRNQSQRRVRERSVLTTRGGQWRALNLAGDASNHYLFKGYFQDLFVLWYLKKIRKFKLCETFRVKCETGPSGFGFHYETQNSAPFSGSLQNWLHLSVAQALNLCWPLHWKLGTVLL